MPPQQTRSYQSTTPSAFTVQGREHVFTSIAVFCESLGAGVAWAGTHGKMKLKQATGLNVFEEGKGDGAEMVEAEDVESGHLNWNVDVGECGGGGGNEGVDGG